MTDPIDIAVIRAAIVSIAREVFGLFQRTAMLPHLYEAKDFSISVFDDRLNLVADAPGLPEFVGSLSVALEAILADPEAGGDLRPGDVLAANDPFLTGGHPADMAMVAPAFAAGRLVGFCGMRAHLGDLGARNTYPADAETVYDEGLIFPPIKVVSEGEPRRDLLRIVAANSRLPDETVGNLRSAAAALLRGTEKLGSLVDRFGFPTYRAALDQHLDAAEAEVRRLLTRIPDGTYTARDTLEMGLEGPFLALSCSVAISGSDVAVDLTGAPGAQPGALNVPLPQTISACRLALKRLTTQDGHAANAGEYRMLTVEVPAGSLFDARRPSATFMMATTASLLSEMVVTALLPVLQSGAAAPSGGHTTGFMSWMQDGPRGRPEIMDEIAPIGFGATAGHDGMDAALHFCLAGMGIASGEVLETRASAVKREFALVCDSGGPGRWRGGLGTRTRWELLTPGTITVQAQRTVAQESGGLSGGLAARGRNDTVIAHGEQERALGMCGGVPVPAGATITVYGAGGGGFGDPLQRPAAEVAADVLDGSVSPESARADYAVILDPVTGEVDEVATTALRRERRRGDD